MKKVGTIFAVFLFLAGIVCGMPEQAHAASATVQFTTNDSRVRVGDEFSIVCEVGSSQSFNDVELNILYDASLFKFLSGGKKVSGGNGVLHISSTGNDDAVKKRTYSLKFRALKKGDGNFDLDESVSVTDAYGDAFSISANLLTVSVASPDKSGETPAPTQPGGTGEGADAGAQPSAGPDAALSSNNKLKALSFNSVSMTPEFVPDVLEYTVGVDCNTEILYFTYVPANNKAKVRIRDNDDLIPGENKVKVVVTAESGEKRTYKINVIKETEGETRVREQKEKGSSDITFSVSEKDGAIFIQNQYQFEVVNAADEDVIPSGYVKTSVELDGKSVPAYTMENDLDNNYLLMYLKGAGGEPTLYQYDRQEKTIQRYTGTMTQKVNQGGTVKDEVEMVPGIWLYAALIGLMILVIALLIVILNMVLRKKIGRGRRELDDMDF